MRRKPLILVLAALLMGILVAGFFYYRYRSSPRYALHQMANALIQHNYERFYARLDLKSVFSQLVEETSKDLAPSGKPEGDYLSQLGWSMGRKFAKQLLPRLFSSFEKDIRTILNKYLATLTTQDLLALEAAVALADINQQGDEARVSLHFPKDERRLRLTMSRAFPDGSWRVVSVSYEDLKKIVKKELE
jgi:hypothetical protein